MSLAPCVYRDLADEAFRIDAVTGAQQRIDLWLCTWPTTLVAVPLWHQKRIGAGPAIDPETDCVNCPVRKA